MEKGEKYLGFDISTKTIGICLLENDGTKHGKILELTHINPKVPKKTHENEVLHLKKKAFSDFIQKYKELGITRVVIESPLLRSNNVNTVSTLLRFNGMIADCIYNELGVVPDYISSYDARKYSFPELMAVRKYGKDEKQYVSQKIIKDIKDCKLVLFGSYPWTIDKKLVMMDKVSEIFPDIKWVYDKNGAMKKENYDAVDSYVCLLGLMNKERYGELTFRSENIEMSDNENGEMTIDYLVKYWNREEKRKTYISKKSETRK